jgi:hypothetical protein
MMLAGGVTSLAAMSSPAAEIQAGLGWSGIDRDGAVSAAVAARGRPLLTIGPVQLRAGAAAQIDADGDLWGGAGPVLGWGFAGVWRLDGAVMPGLYAQGSGADLGGSVQFRSEIGLSRSVGEALRLGLAFVHMSNAGLEDRNPGEDGVYLFVTAPF